MSGTLLDLLKGQIAKMGVDVPAEAVRAVMERHWNGSGFRISIHSAVMLAAEEAKAVAE